MDMITQSGGVLFMMLAFVVALSIIVAIHEYGHYIVGRWCGIAADVFSIGFGPVLLSRVDKRGTRWQIAALPFGGYVKFKGDANAASVGSEPLTAEDAPAPRDTMLGAPLWARAATVAAGPIFNFILSALIFAAFVFSRGEATEPLTVATISPLPAITQELEPGDRVLAIAGMETPPFEEFGDYLDALPEEAELTYTVLRDGAEVTVQGPYPYPSRVAAIQPSSAAFDAGLQTGDFILAVDGAPIRAFFELQEKVAAAGDGEVDLTVWRPTDDGGETFQAVMTPRSVDIPGENGFETRYLIGISGALFFTPEAVSPGIFQTLGYGIAQVGDVISNSLLGLWSIITGVISTCNLSGPISIAKVSGAVASQGAGSFVWFVAVLSTAVGLLNLFPIPVLDGGHLVFHAYEAVSGRPPSDKALRILMSLGLAMIGTLMIFAIFNDLFCP